MKPPRSLTVVCLAQALLAGCVSSDGSLQRALPRDGAATGSAEPVAETRRGLHPGSDVLAWRRRVLVWPDGRVERHGEDAEWYPDGTPRSERSFEHDRPSGVWTSWYEDGTKRSEVDYGDGALPGAMRFWYPDGVLAGEGQGIAGVKEGAWTYWDEAGRRLRAGGYASGLREGPWTFWYEDGKKRAEGSYERGLRTGEWRLWDADGTLVVRQVAAERER